MFVGKNKNIIFYFSYMLNFDFDRFSIYLPVAVDFIQSGVPNIILQKFEIGIFKNRDFEFCFFQSRVKRGILRRSLEL